MDISVILRLVDQLSGPADGARGALGRLGSAAGQMARIGLMAASAAAVAITGALATSTTQAIAFEAAMADVAKVVDFDVGGVGDGIVELSRGTGMAAEDLAALAAAAGQAGMDTQEAVLQFTDMASTVGVAFDLPAAYVGDAMASMQTALGTTVAETGLLADAINHLSNNTAANAARLLDFGSRAASVGEQYGFTAEQTLAVGASMIATGAQAEVAATSFRAVGRALTAGEAATARQTGAFEALGLEATEVARAMQEDAVGTLTDVIARIGQLPAEVRASSISQLFGDEARAIAPLINNLDLLNQSYEMVADQANFAGSSQEEFAARADTAQFRISAIQANWTAMSREAGNALMPALNEGLERLLGTLQSADLQDNWYFRLADSVGDFAEGALGMEIAADEMTRFHRAGAIAADVMEGLGSRMGAFGQGLFDGGSEHVDDLMEALSGLGTALGLDGDTPLMELLFGTEEGWASMGAEIAGFVVGGLADLVNIVTAIVEGFNAASEGVESFVGWISDLTDGIGSIDIDWSFMEPPDWLSGAGDLIGGLFSDDGAAADAAESLAALGDAVPDAASIIDLPSLERAESAAASIAETMTRAGEIDLAPIVRAALQEAQSVLSSEDWSGHGARLMDTLIAGVQSRTGALGSAVSGAIQQGVSQGVAGGLSEAYNTRRQSALQDGVE